MTDAHVSVLKTEALTWLQPKPGDWMLDGTFGLGGHTAALLETGAKVVAFDFDDRAVEAGKLRFAQEIAAGQLILLRENFAFLDQELRKIAADQSGFKLAGALFDFGTSIEQLKYDDRGLSFAQLDQPLDMRLDTRLGVTASDLLKALPEKHLTQLFLEFGGETHAKKLAQAIIKLREKHPEQLNTVRGLIDLVAKVLPPRHGHLNPATKAFQALRIAVNDELTNISRGLAAVLPWIQPGGRIVTIAFHEGEDRIVKDWFLDCESKQLGSVLTKKPVTASETELAHNPRSRSAKLRVFETKQT